MAVMQVATVHLLVVHLVLVHLVLALLSALLLLQPAPHLWVCLSLVHACAGQCN